MTRFIHLNVHSEFSIRDGLIKIPDLVRRTVETGMPAVALTDLSNLFGLVKFYQSCLSQGVKPLIGTDLSLASGDRCANPETRLSVLAATHQGYLNLLELVSRAYTEVPDSGQFRRGVVEPGWLEELNEGLILLSGAGSGEVGMALLAGEARRAEELARHWQQVFGNRFYIELQRTGRDGEDNYIPGALRVASKLGVPVVATNAVRFLDEDDFEAHEARVCIHAGRTLDDPRRERHYSADQYFRSAEEMGELFSDIPEALENTWEIAKRCNVEIELGTYHLPQYPVPVGSSLESYLEQVARVGLEKRLQELQSPTDVSLNPETYHKRLDYELEIINQMGFPGYFLIVMEFIRWAKDNDIPVGPGRGSGAGSLVAYALEITDLDPLKYDLLFERFLNPERVSMPDFDVDFCMEGRDRVIAHVSELYGQDAVSQIITFGTMAAKAVVRDVARVQGKPYGLADKLSKLIPFEVGMTLGKAEEQVQELRDFIAENDEVAEIMDMAYRLEGIVRNVGKHAGGVVIAPSRLTEHVPLYVDEGSGGLVSQFDKDDVERAGLVKFDFLGLKTLTIIRWAVDALNQTRSEDPLDITQLPLDDAAVYELLKSGRTAAVFQLESRGMRELILRQLPDSFEDIVALVALYRPGPLQSGMVDDFVDRKHGRAQVEYPHPALEPVLENTYGVILYQEQVMQIAQVLAGYSLGQADMLRRAMGKKKPEEMATQRKIFMQGAAKKKVPLDKAEQIFDLMEKFAGYGFNKSHSAAYALIAYQTAYLKAHYPQAFMAATLSCDMGNSDKICSLITDCRSMDIPLLPPHVNASDWEFVPEGEQAIRFGLGAVKGVGEAAVRELVRVRRAGEVFSSFEDLCMRLPSRVFNKRMAEALIKAGAFAELVPHTRAALEGLHEAMERAVRKRHDMEAHQSALFEVAEPQGLQGGFPDVQPWGMGECLNAEREVLGFYLTGHPLEEYLGRVEGLANTNLADIKHLSDDAIAVVPIGVSHVRTHRGARGMMAFVQVEDLHAGAEMVCFPELYQEVSEYLDGEQALLACVRIDRSRDELSLIAEAIAPLESVLAEQLACVRITGSALAWDTATIARLKKLAEKNPGEGSVSFHLRLADGSQAELSSDLSLCWNSDVKQNLRAWFGVDGIHLVCRPWQPERKEKKGGRREERRQYAA